MQTFTGKHEMCKQTESFLILLHCSISNGTFRVTLFAEKKVNFNLNFYETSSFFSKSNR